MEAQRNPMPYAPTAIEPAVESFDEQLNHFLGHMGLPQEGILVPVADRKPVFQNMGTALAHLPGERTGDSIYISKFVAACATGLFDAALNYLWDETIKNLRAKVVRFDLQYFYDSLPGNASQTSVFKTESDLENISDSQLIRGCRTTGIITDIGFRHLDYIRNMRNHASAAHPNQNQITGLQLVGWMETCIREVLSKEPGGPVIEVRRLLTSLREQRIFEGDVAPIVNELPSLPDELSMSLLRSVVGIYTDESVASHVKDNIRLIAKNLWGVVPDEARREIGLKYATLAANGDAVKARLVREFIDIVGGQQFLTDSTLAFEISMALDSLDAAHHGRDNFYNEPAPARSLHRLVPDSGSIPPNVLPKYVKTLTLCRIGNGHGICWSAQGYYDDLLMRFSDNTSPHLSTSSAIRKLFHSSNFRVAPLITNLWRPP